MRREMILGPACAAILLAVPGSALAKDRNHDGLPDRWEHRHHLSLKVNQARHDQDRDGLRNAAEFRHGTNPRDSDSDDDGLRDDREVRTANNPQDRDSDDDGVGDGDENAGTVESFTGGFLTIVLSDGSKLRAAVTDRTEIECEGADDHGDGNRGDVPAARAADHGSDDGPGDDGGGQGDARGHRGDERGHQGDERGHQGGNGDDGDNGAAACSTADLTAGTPVHEAEIAGSAAGPVFDKVELVK